MKHTKWLTIMIAPLFTASVSTQAVVEMEMVFVGDPDNPACPDDADYEMEGFQSVGWVPYGYYIGTYEVTNEQYVQFLNAVRDIDLWDSGMMYDGWGGIMRNTSSWPTYTVKIGYGGVSFGKRPVGYMDFYRAARFCNWLTNGQGDADTMTGMYDLTDNYNYNTGNIVRNEAAWQAGGVAIASEDEWCKAAYYDPSNLGPADHWWAYPTRSDVAPNAVGPNNDDPNSANYRRAHENGQYSDVDAYPLARSYYGTYGQAGNAMEMTDTHYPNNPGKRIYRGGYFSGSADKLSVSYRDDISITWSYPDHGFRVTSLKPIGGQKLNWGPYLIQNNHCDTADWMGWLNVIQTPWVYCLKTQCWFYIQESVAHAGSGWIYIPDLTTDAPELWLVMIPDTAWGWSYGLSKWMYVGESGWVYLVT